MHRGKVNINVPPVARLDSIRKRNTAEFTVLCKSSGATLLSVTVLHSIVD